jgi:hypothetical protein
MENSSNLGAYLLDQVTADSLVKPEAKADSSLTMTAAGLMRIRTAWLLFDYRRQLYDAFLCRYTGLPESRIVESLHVHIHKKIM